MSRRLAVIDADTLASILARLSALEARFHAGRRPDPTSDARLLSAIAMAFSGEVFTTEDLQRKARLDSELRAALDGASGREIGAWLRRLHQHPTGRYTLRQVKREGGGWQWELARCI